MPGARCTRDLLGASHGLCLDVPNGLIEEEAMPRYAGTSGLDLAGSRLANILPLARVVASAPFVPRL